MKEICDIKRTTVLYMHLETLTVFTQNVCWYIHRANKATIQIITWFMSLTPRNTCIVCVYRYITPDQLLPDNIVFWGVIVQSGT